MNARTRHVAPAAPAFDTLVDEALDPAELEAAAHPEDWPEPPVAPGLPRAMWDRALGDVARDILGRPSRRFRARLCELAFKLADGKGAAQELLPAAVEIVHAGSLIIDDVEDGSLHRRQAPCVHMIHGVPRALNTGTWMYFWALELVNQLPSPVRTRERLRAALVDALYRGHQGQALDLTVSIGRLPRALVYRTVATSTMLKTGALFELAARVGALAAEAPDARLHALASVGRRLGLGLQMLDDFGNLTASSSDSRDSKALEDLRNGRPTWPWAHAARELGDDAFSDLQADARALLDGGDPDGTRARVLAAKLRIAVGLKGRRDAAAYLQAALAQLRASVGPRAELALIAAEIRRLEASYG